MSKVDKKGNISSQQSLDLFDPTAEEQQYGDLDFVLKIHDGHLHDLKISSIANLLSALGQIVGVDNASFKTIKEGSTTIAVTVPLECRDIAISNVTKDTVHNRKQMLRIQKELKKYHFSNAEISYGTLLENEIYRPTKVLCTVPEYEKEETFKQKETLDGSLSRLQKGKDKSDHISIVVHNGDEIPAECSKQLLKELHPYFDTDTRLRFEGDATYLLGANSYQPTLKKYTINKFYIIENVDLDDWIKNFRSKGASNWNKHDDPIAEWLKERQD